MTSRTQCSPFKVESAPPVAMPAAKKANVLSDKTIIRAGRNVACLKIDIKYIQKEVENMREIGNLSLDIQTLASD